MDNKLLESIKKLFDNEKKLNESADIQRVLPPADADAFEQHEEALKQNAERRNPDNYAKEVKEVIKDTASEESRYRHFDVVDRKDLAKKINEAKAQGLKYRISRNEKEGFRYNFDILNEEFKKEEAGDPEVNTAAFNKATDIQASSPTTGLGEDVEEIDDVEEWGDPVPLEDEDDGDLDLDELKELSELEEGDKITVTADMLTLFKKAFDMAKEYDVDKIEGEECPECEPGEPCPECEAEAAEDEAVELDEAFSDELINRFAQHEFFKLFKAMDIKKLIRIYKNDMGIWDDSDLDPEEVAEYITDGTIGGFILDNIDNLTNTLIIELAKKDPKFMKALRKYYPKSEEMSDVELLNQTFDVTGDAKAETVAELSRIYNHLNENLLKEDLRVFTGTLTNFIPSSQAEELWNEIKAANKIQTLEDALEVLYPEGISDTALDDLLKHEADWIRDLIDLNGEAVEETPVEEPQEEAEEEPADELDYYDDDVEPVWDDEEEDDLIDDEDQLGDDDFLPADEEESIEEPDDDEESELQEESLNEAKSGKYILSYTDEGTTYYFTDSRSDNYVTTNKKDAYKASKDEIEDEKQWFADYLGIDSTEDIKLIKVDRPAKESLEEEVVYKKNPGDGSLAKLKQQYPNAVVLRFDGNDGTDMGGVVASKDTSADKLNNLKKDDVVIVDNTSGAKTPSGTFAKLKEIGCKVIELADDAENDLGGAVAENLDEDLTISVNEDEVKIADESGEVVAEIPTPEAAEEDGEPEVVSDEDVEALVGKDPELTAEEKVEECANQKVEECAKQEVTESVTDDDDKTESIAEGFIKNNYKENTLTENVEDVTRAAVQEASEEDEVVAIDDSQIDEMLGCPKSE